MEFWGVEVKSGEPLVVKPGDDMILHLSQACLGEVKKDKGNDSIYLYVNVGGQKLVLGTLLTDKLPQITFDIVFEKKFELSHNWKNGSVFFSGYKTVNPVEPSSDFSDSEEEEDLPVRVANNGKPEVQATQAKPAAEKADVVKRDITAQKQKVKIVEPNKDVPKEKGGDSDSDEDDDSTDDDDLESEDDDENMPKAEYESNDEDDESDEDDDESDEETPKKAAPSKKRPVGSANKTPISDKKAKLVTPQKTDGKKGGGHVATPHPSKQAGKTPASHDKSKPQPPKSVGSFQCKSCSRSFNSDNALQSHTKAKHSAGN